MSFFVKFQGACSLGLKLVLGQAVSVGRSIDRDIVIEELAVSRRQCTFLATEEGVLVKDLESLHGTHVNGVALPPGGEWLARPGDRIRLGTGKTELIITRVDGSGLSTRRMMNPVHQPA